MPITLRAATFWDRSEAIVNPVNCEGVMSRGVSADTANFFRTQFEEYKQACESGNVKIGEMLVSESDKAGRIKWIIHFPIKTSCKVDSSIEDIKAGLDDLVKVVKDLNIQTLAIPALGCGIHGLEFETVYHAIKERFGETESSDISVYGII